MKKAWTLAAMVLPSVLSGRDVRPVQIAVEARIVEVGPGIQSANFGTNLGNVYANFPSDLAAGDRISGTFATLPKGSNEAERAANAVVLRPLTIEVFGSDFPVGVGLFFCPSVSGDSIRMVLKVEQRELGSQMLSVPRVATLPARPSFILPDEGLVFNRALILGPFAGDLQGTSVRIGGTAARVVAESPRACVFDVPEDPVGPTRIEFHEGSSNLSGFFRTVGLHLTPPRPIIHTGDSTSFAAEVTGLAGLEHLLHMNLKNLSTEIVSMEGGEEQSITIAPSDVSAAGTFAIARRLTETRRGRYTINVSVSTT
jgi:hypothetical protein